MPPAGVESSMVSPDSLERVGIVVGSVLLLALPTSAFSSLLVGDPAPQVVLLWTLPGLVVGTLVATGRLPVSYRQVWVFSIVSWIVVLLLSSALDVDPARGTTALPIALAAGTVALAIGAVAAWRNVGGGREAAN
ncbi:hypothetical protein [Halomicrococcus sp. SG-WS-1]|uniref:hypothetical protein n=1 Tax=Halomicrococcus sp. SG-WS-1 TaxID=3439057 RepID=UPI003F795980